MLSLLDTRPVAVYKGSVYSHHRFCPMLSPEPNKTEAVKKAFLASRPEHVHTRTQCANEGVDWDGNLSTVEGLTTGAISGAVAGVLTTPFDVVKTRIQLMVFESRFCLFACLLGDCFLCEAVATYPSWRVWLARRLAPVLVGARCLAIHSRT